METLKTLKSGSRLDNKNGHLITTKSYQCRIIKRAPFNYVYIKIGSKIFKTDYANITLNN